MSPINDNGKPPWLNQPVGANTVNSAAIIDGQVMIADLADDSVTPAKLQDTGSFIVDQLTATSAVTALQMELSGDSALNANSSATPTSICLRAGLVSDSEARFTLDRNGKASWGDGTNPADIILSRSAASTFEINAPLIDIPSGSILRLKGADGSGPIYFGPNGEVVLEGVTVPWEAVRTPDGLIVEGNAAIGSAPTDTIGFYGETPVVQAAAIAAPTAPGVVYSQAEAQSMEAAVNAIRLALAGIGITA